MARSYAGKTAFIEACAGGHADGAKVLMENSTFLGIDLNAKSNINAKSKIGSTAFHESCKYYRTRIVELMVDKADALQLDLNARNRDGRTGYQLAQSS